MYRRCFLALLAAGALTGCADLQNLAQPETPAIPVRQAQAGLTALGYRVGPVDGVLGPMTAAAITRFRNREGLGAPRGSLPKDGIDGAFSDRLAERLAFDGLRWRQRARTVRARQTATPEPPPDGERDEALEDLLNRWEAAPPAE
ncbi:MAG: peptidoglycan-binding domain-containing protein [Pseudomonadota bacterium]